MDGMGQKSGTRASDGAEIQNCGKSGDSGVILWVQRAVAPIPKRKKAGFLARGSISCLTESCTCCLA